MINLVPGSKKEVKRPLQRSRPTRSDPQGDVALGKGMSELCRGDVTPRVTPRGALLGYSHPSLLPAALSVWEGGVKEEEIAANCILSELCCLTK